MNQKNHGGSFGSDSKNVQFMTKIKWTISFEVVFFWCRSRPNKSVVAAVVFFQFFQNLKREYSYG